MRKTAVLILLLAVLFSLPACAGKKVQETEKTDFMITDYCGKKISFPECPKRVVALMGSFGEMWLDAGGSLVGITDDALTERGLDAGEVMLVGTVKKPNIELIVSLEPDFVILSADTASQLETAETLTDMGIPFGSFHVETFEDYLALLKAFTDLTGREDLYKKNGEEIGVQIEKVLERSADFSGKTALLLRAFSTGWRAKDSSTLAGTMIADFGFENVVEKYESPLEQISLEEIAVEDPDYIFITLMGTDTEAALKMLETELESSPVWKDLNAVKNGRCFVLPQELFHFKPNTRWGEAYEYLSQLINETEAAP